MKSQWGFAQCGKSPYIVSKKSKCSTKAIDKKAVVEYNNGEVMIMQLIYSVLEDERKRNEYMLERYEKELSLLPKGKITPKITKANTYYYLKYRDGQKVCAKYIGMNEEDIALVAEQLKRRKVVESLVKELKAEQAKIRKMEAIV